MSTVTKCDICGEIYGYNPEKMNSTFRAGVSKHIYDITDKNLDLCPECTKRVLEFIEVLKTGNQYVIMQEDPEI